MLVEFYLVGVGVDVGGCRSEVVVLVVFVFGSEEWVVECVCVGGDDGEVVV